MNQGGKTPRDPKKKKVGLGQEEDSGARIRGGARRKPRKERGVTCFIHHGPQRTGPHKQSKTRDKMGDNFIWGKTDEPDLRRALTVQALGQLIGGEIAWDQGQDEKKKK